MPYLISIETLIWAKRVDIVLTNLRGQLVNIERFESSDIATRLRKPVYINLSNTTSWILHPLEVQQKLSFPTGCKRSNFRRCSYDGAA